MRILVVNAGSSSLKLQLVDERDRVAWDASLPARGGRFDRRAARELLRAVPATPDAVGHRVVHGGRRFRGPVAAGEGTLAELESLVELAPLHQPAAIAALRIARDVLADVPHYCCFDTAFHATLPPAASTYALPRRWREQWGVRRYGFHGLSHAWVARRAPELVGRPGAELRIVSCHLGAGASVCAIARGRSVDTSMGFTPLAGLVMATRCGDVDPGLLLWLLTSGRVEPARLGDALQHESGLHALAGTADMRVVLERAEGGDAEARGAVDVVVHRLRASIAAMAASIGGLDALAFTGGVGEGGDALRARTVEGLGFLGAACDPALNRRTTGDGDVSAARARARTLVVSAREHLEIARQGRALLGRPAAAARA